MSVKSVAPPPEALALAPKSSLKKKFKDGKYLFLLVIPTIICLALFYYLPMYGIIIAFMDYKPFNGITGSEWVGLDNFTRFFNYKFFWRILLNTLQLSVYSMLWGFPAPILLALVLNETTNVKFKKVVQTISYMPHFYSTVVVVGLFTMMLAPTGGLITKFLENFGITDLNLLADSRYFRTLYIMSEIWQSVGWGAIIYLAALTNVDPQLYEAATVDGAGKLRCLWSITLPSIAPTIVTMLLLSLGGMLNIGFERAFLFQKPTTLETSEIISTYVYKAGLQTNNFSYGTAVGLFNSVISLVLLLASNFVAQRVSETSLW
ncbi:MAG: ABC transporter permease subunit [Clostridia bacterium]